MNKPSLFSWRRIFGIFLSGLFAMLPIVVTLAVVMWLVGVAEQSLGGLLRTFLPSHAYLPGMGLLLSLGFIFVVGLLTHAIFFRQVLDWFEVLIDRIPLVKTVFHAVKDLTGFMSRAREGKKKFGQVVLVKAPDFPIRMIGFVTVDDLAELDLPGTDGEQVAVYLPMSYQIGGYTVLLPRDYLTPVDMGVEEAMRLVITAGLSRGDDNKHKPGA